MHRRIVVGLVALGLTVPIALGACSPTDVDPSSSQSPAGPGTPAPTPTAIPTPTTSFSALPAGTYAIECGADQHNPDAVVVLSQDEYRVGGWNHVNGVGSFATVALEPSEYAVSGNQYLPDATCGGANTLGLVLAKKTYDWDRQHANGMESQFSGEEMRFGDVESIVLEIRLDPTRSVLPQPADYEERYGDLLTAEQLAELDGGNVNLELTLFGNGSGGDPQMNAGTIIEVDPEQVGDGWLRVKVPRDELTFYTERNYERTEVGPEANQDLVVAGLRINPETASGNEVRVYVGDDFDIKAKPELFKEMAIAFSVIEIERSK